MLVGVAKVGDFQVGYNFYHWQLFLRDGLGVRVLALSENSKQLNVLDHIAKLGWHLNLLKESLIPHELSVEVLHLKHEQVEVIQALLAREHVVNILADTTCDLVANENLVISDWPCLHQGEVAQERKQNGLLLGLFREGVNELDGLFDDRCEVVGKEAVGVLENLADKLPSVHTVLHVVQKQVKVFHQHLLVLLVIAHELQQKYVGFLKNTEVRVLIAGVLQGLLPDQDYGNFVGSKVSEQALVLFVVDLVVIDDLRVLVVKVLQQFTQVEELQVVLVSLFLILLSVVVNHSLGVVHAQVSQKF